MSDLETARPESLGEEEDRVDIYGTGKIVVVARSAIRFLLSQAEASNTVITRSKLQSVIKDISRKENCSRFPFKEMYDVINMILMDIYGYYLHALPPRSTGQRNQTNPVTSTEENPSHRSDHFILLKKLPAAHNFDKFKSIQNSSVYGETIVNEEYVGDDMSLPSNSTLGNRLGVDQDMVMQGLLGVTLTIILFSKNNILHQELMNKLKSFGIPIDGTRIPILNLTIDEFLKVIERGEYIVKLAEKSDLEEESIVYSVGRRTQAEFPLESLTGMVREITGLDSQQAPTLMEDIQLSIGDAYTKS
ncbi:non-structural maintenance of chromosome element 3 [Monosporozyma servazzii]